MLAPTSSPPDKHGLLRFVGTVAGRPARILIDSGASHDVINLAFATAAEIPVADRTTMSVGGAVSSAAPQQVTHPNGPVPVSIGRFSFVLPATTIITALSETYDILLGMPWHVEYEPKIDYAGKRVVLRDGTGRIRVLRARNRPGWNTHVAYGLNTISMASCTKELRRGKAELFHVLVTEAVVGTSSTGVALGSLSNEKFTALLEEFRDTHPADLPEGLPPSREEEFSINLLPGSSPPRPRASRLSHAQQEELRVQLERLLALGLVRPSSSPFGASVFFVSKPDGKWRMVSDWRALNDITVKDATTLPSMYEMLDSLRDAKYLSKLDLNGGFNQVRVKDADAHKTAIRTPLGSFEFLAMPMGLCNAPATFQRLMNRVLHGQIGRCCFVYLDDILIFSNSEEDHLQHLREVLTALRNNQLYAKPGKCLIATPEIQFLGHVVGNGQLKVDPSKIAHVDQVPAPTNVHSLRRFLGFVNFFRRFVPRFANIAAPLHGLTHRNTVFLWSEGCQSAFEQLRAALVAAPVLQLPDFNRPFIISADASNIAVGAVLMQEDDAGNRYAVAYRSRALDEVKQHWPTHERELFAIVDSVLDWHYYIDGAGSFTVETDHKPLLHVFQQRDLSAKQVRWLEKLSRYNLRLVYKPGTTQVISDWLSRPDSPGMLQPAVDVQVNSIEADCVSEYNNDPFFARLGRPGKSSERFRLHNGLWYLEETGQVARLCVPTVQLQRRLMEELHDTPMAAHPGRDRMAANLTRRFFWPRMAKHIADFVAKCPACQRSKPRPGTTPGLLQPLPIPAGAWASISVDFMTDLPRTQRGRDALLVVVDRFSKMIHLTAVHKSDSAAETARVMTRDVIRLHGVPREIVSDRDPKFTSELWGELWTGLGTKLSMSTAAHPQTDGQTERANRTVNAMIRALLQDVKTDWEDLLPLIEFAYNSSAQASTGRSPFSIIYGREPRAPVDVLKGEGSGADTTGQGFSAAHLRTITQQVHDSLILSQQHQKQAADLYRKKELYAKGDWVLVATDRIGTDHLENTTKSKWQSLWRGPFQVLGKINDNAYRIALPEDFEGHDVINITYLKRWLGTRPEPDPPLNPPPPTEPEAGPRRSSRAPVPNTRILGPDFITTRTTAAKPQTSSPSASAAPEPPVGPTRHSSRVPIPNPRYVSQEAPRSLE